MIEATAGELIDAVNGFMNLVQAYIELTEGQHAAELSMAIRPLRDIIAPYQTKIEGLINQYGKPAQGARPGTSTMVVGADAEGYQEFVEKRNKTLQQVITIDIEPIVVSAKALERTNAATVFAVAPFVQIVASPEAYKILAPHVEDRPSP